MFKEIFQDILKDLGVVGTKRPNEIFCPNCQNKMKILSIVFKGSYSTDKLKIDFCENCESIWFDRGELIKALEMDVKDISKYFPSRTKESVRGTGKRLCPICKSYMTLINYSKDTGIWIDLCPNGCGIFLDAGELELIKLYSLGAFKQQVTDKTLTQPSKQYQTNLENELSKLAEKIIDIKININRKIRNIETIIKNKDLKKMKEFLNKNVFEQELKELGEVSIQIKNLYSNYGNLEKINELQNTVQNIIKSIDIRSNSISERLSTEIKLLESLKESEKEKYISFMESKTELKEAKTELKTELKETKQQEPENKPTTTLPSSLPSPSGDSLASLSGGLSTSSTSAIGASSSSSVTKEEQKQVSKETKDNLPSKTEVKTDKVTQPEKYTKIEKIRLPGFENIFSYFVINDDLFVYSENKIFAYKNNSFEEIKIKELNFRIKKIKVIDDTIFVLGSSGNIMLLNLSFEYKNIYKVGYSDILNLLKIKDKFIAFASNRVYNLNNDFKIIEEKTLNTNFIELYSEEGRNFVVGGTSNLIIFDENLNKIEEYSIGSFQTIKKTKILENSLFLLGSGLLVRFKDKQLNKFNLPKSYLEVNDIEKIEEFYYIACNSGGLYKTLDFNNYHEIKLDTFDNIYSVILYKNRIILTCANSNIIILS